MARTVNIKYECTKSTPKECLLMIRASSVCSDLIEFYCSDAGDEIFVHQSLLEERSLYFSSLIRDGQVLNHGHLAIFLHSLSHATCVMLARWLYGQPLRATNDNPEDDLEALELLYDFACDMAEESEMRYCELVNACLDAIKYYLTQKAKTLDDPIENLEAVLVKNERFPGKAVILRQLVYGECATDGRTKIWLEQYCAHGHEDAADIAKLICMEFAKKACEQS